MPSDDWETAPDDFLEEPTTDVTQPEIDDRAGTVPRCMRCGRELKTGGDAAQPTWAEMSVNAADACWRSMSGAWAWCSGFAPLTLTVTGDVSDG